MKAQTMFDPSTPLATATVQDIHLELMRRSEHNAFHGTRVLAALLAHHQDWQAVLFDTYGLATDRGLPARLLKLRDMASDDYSQEDTERALGTSCASKRLVQMWWDECAAPLVIVTMIAREACPGCRAVHRVPSARVRPQPCCGHGSPG